jgi:hypothetical protein
MAQEQDVMVALRALDESGIADTTLVPLASAAEKERGILREWLGGSAVPLKQEFFSYLRPLVGAKDEHIRDLGAPVSGKRE